ncbi:uncharacterized protein BO95DRAFT_447280 [Aspergillus brunneoviolaceus CBS 621.78]|uniref:Uncharacterized protein n=1 Tax=Aspergillus brunneoviolaceus CBS 621.78 TaxID=1450534 RepID=A0ACD1FVT5_9EURO|nr:hypothetical protein BO95DRAFT_447280 [Aspergillus brunneoviolaceus CBS 621.78]RAH41092.1 hypothetical protein BO95DRAFT_447280 [Aspergillus brunneoviolaceus CBS 621.78]
MARSHASTWLDAGRLHSLPVTLLHLLHSVVGYPRVYPPPFRWRRNSAMLLFPGTWTGERCRFTWWLKPDRRGL